MPGKLFSVLVYVKVSKNRFQVRCIDNKNEITVSAVKPFTTKRLLVGDFNIAEQYLKEGINKVHEGRWISASPEVVIQPLEMIEEGLSPVEERLFKELAAGAGARKMAVWVGHELSDPEVIQHAKNV